MKRFFVLVLSMAILALYGVTPQKTYASSKKSVVTNKTDQNMNKTTNEALKQVKPEERKVIKPFGPIKNALLWVTAPILIIASLKLPCNGTGKKRSVLDHLVDLYTDFILL
jgi:hypothetical protein